MNGTGEVSCATQGEERAAYVANLVSGMPISVNSCLSYCNPAGRSARLIYIAKVARRERTYDESLKSKISVP